MKRSIIKYGMSDHNMLWEKIRQEIVLGVLGEVNELIIKSVVIDKTIFERSPEGGEEANHAGV